MSTKKVTHSIQKLSVIVPVNPFVPVGFQKRKHCLCALNVEKLMEWWPGTPHSPHRNPTKVKAIQRSLDWKRVAQIAAYLLQKEITDAPDRIDKYFRTIYQPRKNEPGREWPPRIGTIVGFQRSEFPTFSNVLLHVNGAQIIEFKFGNGQEAAKLIFDEYNPELSFSVIDGQHRINGAYLAVKIMTESNPSVFWEIPSEVFLALDQAGEPRIQAQIFIDVNFYQKKVDKSLVADLFPTARGDRGPLDDKERAQDIGRKLMLETGPLVGMIQIPGIKYGVKDVITLATLNNAIEEALPTIISSGVESLEAQTSFLAQCLSAWFEASGRFEEPKNQSLTPQNVAYQGRILVSILTLVPAIVLVLKKKGVPLISDKALNISAKWLRKLAERAELVDNGKFLDKDRFKQKGYHGAGGIGRFRDSLWAVASRQNILGRLKPERINALAKKNMSKVARELSMRR